METDPGQDLTNEVPEKTPGPLKSDAALHDPFGWYERKREVAPVHYDRRRDVYDVFTHEHVKRALQDSDRFVRKQLSRSHADDQSPFAYLDNAMVWSDGPGHKQSKAQLFEYFRPDMLAGIADSIGAATERQLDAALRSGPRFDFVSEFAVPVPLRVIMDVIGIPAEDHDQLLTWLETFRSVMNSEYSAEESTDEARMGEAVTYFRELVAKRQADPQADLVSQLATETELSDAEIGSNCFDFILAGQGTMSELLSNALYLFAAEDLLETVEAYDLPTVLEEVLRYRSPLQSRARETTRPVTLHGTNIPSGATVILWIGAANRDPAVYDAPDQFRPDRDPQHLAFGSGAHSCIGAPLARLQAPIVLETFFDRVGGVTLDDDAAEPKPKASKLGFERLPVTVEGA